MRTTIISLFASPLRHACLIRAYIREGKDDAEREERRFSIEDDIADIIAAVAYIAARNGLDIAHICRRAGARLAILKARPVI